MPIFYFNGQKRPPDNCYVICLLREKLALPGPQIHLVPTAYPPIFVLTVQYLEERNKESVFGLTDLLLEKQTNPF